MNTAVQLRHGRDDGPRAELVYGSPSAMVAAKVGPIAVFSSGALVAYRIGRRRRTRLFVFRTLDVDDRLAASLPGVHPRVQLLFEVRSAARARMVRHLFRYLAKSGRDSRSLPDGFYVRVGVVLGGRLPAHKVLLSLLAHSLGPGPPHMCGAGSTLRGQPSTTADGSLAEGV